jgi:hypothetical protein
MNCKAHVRAVSSIRHFKKKLSFTGRGILFSAIFRFPYLGDNLHYPPFYVSMRFNALGSAPFQPPFTEMTLK